MAPLTEEIEKYHATREESFVSSKTSGNNRPLDNVALKPPNNTLTPIPCTRTNVPSTIDVIAPENVEIVCTKFESTQKTRRKSPIRLPNTYI